VQVLRFLSGFYTLRELRVSGINTFCCEWIGENTHPRVHWSSSRLNVHMKFSCCQILYLYLHLSVLESADSVKACGCDDWGTSGLNSVLPFWILKPDRIPNRNLRSGLLVTSLRPSIRCNRREPGQMRFGGVPRAQIPTPPRFQTHSKACPKTGSTLLNLSLNDR
jgi:hypothetical protein